MQRNDAVTPVAGSAKWLLVLSAIVGSSVFEFAWTIVGVALPQMQGAFSATEDKVTWVMTSFMMGCAVAIACIGWLSDRFGRKRVFILSIGGFTFTLIMCATSNTLFEESFWRFMQGALGAGILPLGQAITLDAFPSDQQGRATAVWGNGVVLGGIMGPVIGGVIVEYFSWPWIFWLNVPVGLLALIGVIIYVPEIESEPERPMDWLGFFLLTSGLATLQIMLNRGERLDWFESPEIQLEALYTAVSLYLFVVHSWTARTPFFRPQLFSDRNFLTGQLFIMINGALAILPLVLLPLLLQNVGGYPAITAGGLIIFRGIGLIIGLSIMTQISDRVDGRILLVTGLFIMGVSGWGMSVWTVNISPFDVIWTNTLQGVASGIIYVQITALAFYSLPSRFRTEGFAVFHTLFFAGSAIGVAGIVFVHTRTSQISHANLSAFITPFREIFSFSTTPDEWSLHTLSGLESIQEELARQASMIAYNNTFFAVAMLSFVAIPFAGLFRLTRRHG
ncbi:MAG: DHA2 family efflux MFS transporter permease subunit [Gammaproteobacteria bacterium]|nr:DHA2 family efflux MFS transporter permease subunit [Gammaproteobacteria bacterium]